MNEIDLGQLGRQRFFNFCNTIKNLILDDAVKVDLVVASGNSGLAVGKFTEMIYEELGLSFPKKLSIPFYRFLPGYHDDLSKIFNNGIFLSDVVKQLKNIDNMENVLFVDDEIGQGITAIGIFKLINQALEKLGRVKIKNKPETMNSYLGLLKHGNTNKLKNVIKSSHAGFGFQKLYFTKSSKRKILQRDFGYGDKRTQTKR